MSIKNNQIDLNSVFGVTKMNDDAAAKCSGGQAIGVVAGPGQSGFISSVDGQVATEGNAEFLVSDVSSAFSFDGGGFSIFLS